jgi:hypothetical protein
MLRLLARTKLFPNDVARQRREARPDELRWEDASGVFTLAAGLAVSVLAILTLLG